MSRSPFQATHSLHPISRYTTRPWSVKKIVPQEIAFDEDEIAK
jgi:hypothetical protein